MAKTRSLSLRHATISALPVVAIDDAAARRAFGATNWPSKKFAVVELPDSNGIGALAPLLRNMRGREVIVWPAPDTKGRARAQLHAELFAAAGAAAVGVAKPDGITRDTDTLVETALQHARARALPPQGDRPAQAVLAWSGAINPQETLNELTALLTRHVDVVPNLIEAIALWCLHAWCVRTRERPFAMSPRLVLKGENAFADHVRALRIIAWVTPAPLIVSRTIASHVLATLETGEPTLLFDDIAGGMLYRRDMRTLIAAGAMRDGAFLGPRTRRNPTGHAPCFAPTAIATTADMPDDVRLRCITLSLRAPRQEPAERPPLGDPPEGIATLRAKLQAVAQTLAPSLLHIKAEAPRTIHPTARATWAPIIALGIAIGGYAGTQAVRAAPPATIDEAPSAIALLQDLHTLYGTVAEHIPTARMLADLGARGDPDRPLDAGELARRLAAFGLEPVPVRIDDFVLRGYRANDLAAAFARYLPNGNGVTSHTDVTARSARKSQCNAVTPEFEANIGAAAPNALQ